MENNFSSLGVASKIVEAIKEMDFVTPTDVQQEVIPYIMKNKDLIVMSKTGSGKTGAFGIPMLQSIDPKGHGPRGLILTPTRELAVQVDQDLKRMSKYLDIRTTAVYGQHDMNMEIQALKSAAIVTGTPGRVFDHLSRRTLDTKNIQFLVLDEADRMLDMGFIDQVVQIIKVLPSKRVTLLFSATIPSEIKRICQSYMHQPITIELKSDTMTVETVKQVYYRVQGSEKRTQLDRLLKVEQPKHCMIFCNTRDEVDRVQVYLARKGYVAEALHGANTQSRRMKTIQKFKEGALQILVATDVAARGIHIEDLSLVINYDVPGNKDSYVHRIGRTARAGNSGKAITLVTNDDIMSLYEIEEHVGVLLEEVELPSDAYVKECVDKNPQPIRQPKVEAIRQPKVEPIRQPKVEAIRQPKVEPIRQPKVEAIRQPKVEPIRQPKIEAIRELRQELPQPKPPKEIVKKPKEVTIMVKNIGPVKVIYREEQKEKKNLNFAKYFLTLFKKDKSQ